MDSESDLLSGKNRTQPLDPVEAADLSAHFSDTSTQFIAEIHKLRKRNTELERAKTELVRNQETLAQSEESYRDLYDYAPDMFASVDAVSGLVVSCNQTLADEIGCGKAEIVGRHITTLYCPSCETARRAVFKQFVEEGEVRDAELQLRRKDGSLIDVSLNISSARNEKGEVRYSRSIWRNITATKRVNKKLLEAERREHERLVELEHIYDSAPIGLCVMDTNLRYLRINKRLADINGVSVEDHLGRTLREIIPEIADSMEEVYTRVIETGEPALDVVVTGATPGHPNEKRTYMASYYPLLDDKGKVWRLSSIVRDITEQRRADAELQKANDNLEERVRERTNRLAKSNSQLETEVVERKRMQRYFWRLLQSSPDPIVLIEQEGTVRFANARMESVFGYASGTMLGLSVEDLMPNRFQKMHPALRAEYSANPQIRPMGTGRELVGLCKDGTEFPVEISLSPVQIDNESLVLCSIRDVTEQKKQAFDTRRLRDELAHVLRVESIGQIAASLAHELNQPLTGIVTNAEAGIRLLDRVPPDVKEVRAALHDLASDGHRAGEVIRRLRELTKRTQSGRAVHNINDIVRDSIKFVRSELVEHNVSVSLELSDGVSTVFCDRVQIQQLILNLIINSIGALKQVSKRARSIAILSEQSDSEYVVVTVRDSGTGIAHDTLGDVFEPFLTTKAEGMGMGLSISRTIVEDHGGTIWAGNNEGAGATFSFTLPADEDHAD